MDSTAKSIITKKVLDLQSKGLTITEIAEEIGFGRSFVYSILREHRDPRPMPNRAKWVIPPLTEKKPDRVIFYEWARNLEGETIMTPEGKQKVKRVYPHFLQTEKLMNQRMDLNHQLKDHYRVTSWTLGEVYHLNKRG